MSLDLCILCIVCMVCLYVCMYVYIIYIYIYTYVYMYVRVYVCICNMCNIYNMYNAFIFNIYLHREKIIIQFVINFKFITRYLCIQELCELSNPRHFT